jgi:hypothetical protein
MPKGPRKTGSKNEIAVTTKLNLLKGPLMSSYGSDFQLEHKNKEGLSRINLITLVTIRYTSQLYYKSTVITFWTIFFLIF